MKTYQALDYNGEKTTPTRTISLGGFLATVYAALRDELDTYEFGFSDVDSAFLAGILSCPKQAINSAIGHLECKGAIDVCRDGVNGVPASFLHVSSFVEVVLN